MRVTDYGLWLGPDSHNVQKWIPVEKPLSFPKTGELSGFFYFSGRPLARYHVKKIRPYTYIVNLHIWHEEDRTIVLEDFVNETDFGLMLLCWLLERTKGLQEYVSIRSYIDNVLKKYALVDQCVYIRSMLQHVSNTDF